MADNHHASDDERALARMVLEASDREQRLIGQELHDGLCQELAGIAFLMQSMQHRLNTSGKVKPSEAADVTQLLCKAVSHARGLSHGLYPVAPEPNGLIVALQRLADDTADAFDVTCRFRSGSHLPSLVADSFVATNLFRIAQEAVRIATRSGKVRLIKVSLTARRKQIVMSVAVDRRRLSESDDAQETDGLMLMAHRARLIGAELNIRSPRRTGAQVRCRLPI